MPVRVRKTELAQAFWQAITLREELWHGRDFSAKLAVIRRWSADDRARPPDGMKLPDWGPPVATVYPTGAFALLDVRSTVTEQAAWLRRENPGWLLAFPSNLRFLARHCRDHAIAVPGLRGCRTFGEMLTDDTRAAVRDAWGVEIADMYSAVEVGYIALQCPAAPHYHVQAESALVEVLDAEGRPCGPGAVGEVVVTSLHNFAMPLLRYAIGDLAEVGPPCPCGRGLPVLRRILGRAKDMVVLPSGERRVALFGGKGFAAIEALLQYQLVQTTRDALELHVVTRRPLAAAEEDRLRATIRSSLGHDFAIAFVYRDEIARSASGKYEDFRSELPG
jgi:phenylacetate-CoA ligase